MAPRGRARQTIATDLGVHRRAVTRWVNASCDDGRDGLRPKKANGTPCHIPAPLAEAIKRWVLEGPAEPGRDRANGTRGKRADHRITTKGVRTSGRAMSRFGSGIDIRRYRPTDRHARGDPVKPAQARDDRADLGKGQRPVNSSC